MPLAVTCQSCQAKFSVKDELAGKRVACPKCKAPLAIPAAPAAPAAPRPTAPAAAATEGPAKKILVRCACGAAMQVDVQLVGRTGKCPKCGQPVKIVEAPPAAPKPAARTSEADGTGRPNAARPPKPPPVPKLEKPEPRPASRFVPGARKAAAAATIEDDEATPHGEVKFKKTGTFQRILGAMAGSGLKVNWVRLGVRGGLAAALLVGGYLGYSNLGVLTSSVKGLLGQVEIPQIESPFAAGEETPATTETPPAIPAADPAIEAFVARHGSDKVVTLAITDRVGGQSRAAYEVALAPLADSSPGEALVTGGPATWEARLAPVADVAALASKLKLGEVGQVDAQARRIELTVTTALPVPAGTPAPPAPTPTPSADPIAAALADLKSGEEPRQLRGSQALVNLKPDERRREVDEALEPLLMSAPSNGLREAAGQALKTWADAESVPALIEALEDDHSPVRMVVMQTMARLKDPRTPEPVAKHLLTEADRVAASSCLREMGVISEKATVGYLLNDDPTVRLSAVRILQYVGERLSLPPLNRIVQRDPVPEIKSAAAEALTFVESRIPGGNVRRRRGR